MEFALAPIDAVFIAILAILILLAGFLLLELLFRSVGTWLHIPGAGTIANAIGRANRVVMDAMSVGLGRYAKSAISWIIALPYHVRTLAGQIEATLWALSRTASSLVRQIIPQLRALMIAGDQWVLTRVSAFAQSAFNSAIAYITRIRDYVLTEIVRARVAVATYAKSLFDLAIRQLLLEVARLVAHITGVYNTLARVIVESNTTILRAMRAGELRLQANAEALARWAVNSAVAAATDWARRYADRAIAIMLGALEAETAVILAPAWPTLADAADAIARALPGTIADVLRRLRAIPRVIPRDLPLSIGAAIAAAAIALRWIKDCGLGLCRNLSGFGDEIAALEEELIIADLLIMVAVAASNPSEAASDMVDEVMADMRGLAASFTDIVHSSG